MTEAIEQLLPRLAALSASERAEVAHYLISTLESQEQEDDGVEAAWDQELARRAAEIRAGNAVGKPAAEVFADLDERFP